MIYIFIAALLAGYGMYLRNNHYMSLDRLMGDERQLQMSNIVLVCAGAMVLLGIVNLTS